MQSGSREYIGRNEFWTPSTIGLTQSLIDTSINKIELKDNSSESNLFTVENNKLKSTIPLICDDPTDNEDVSNKKYIDDKITDLNTSINTSYYNKGSIDSKFNNYYNKTYIDTIYSNLNTKVTNLSNSAATLDTGLWSPLAVGDHSISSVPSLSFSSSSFIQTVPTINLNLSGIENIGLKLITVNFYIYTSNSSDVDAMKDLICTVNKYPSKPEIGTFNKPILLGTTGSNNKIYAKYQIIEITTYGFDSSTVYLHFFFENDKSYSNPSFTLDNSTSLRLSIAVHNFTQK